MLFQAPMNGITILLNKYCSVDADSHTKADSDSHTEVYSDWPMIVLILQYYKVLLSVAVHL
jgi:hypothetical protein